ncbi:pyridoxamine 5'-phosphate oxidase family protein [Halobellus marinus]|jgi:nitroimidazol reductase NimA-like FMN-containing flavoprotein (pyridoxamine 5'-phosphate oxidase superfamily)|uniref:pyridoxamine 5'-phosphate oxidase family protein n=1 Tax=Halobellus TaxID=1073986 RepID=UPI0028A7E73F|nr:pyridoxamine 5'-phosphate oxidase family protein [Halobellus sp. DFY28]
MGNEEYGGAMSKPEIAAFLERQGHGVLSLGGEIPYSLPISFGYDVFENRCIFQLLFPTDSRKRDRLEDTTGVSLVSYEWNDIDDWRSVVITGALCQIDDESPAVMGASEVFAEHASVAGLSGFNRPMEELDAEWYELDIEEMSGRHSPPVE